MAKIRVSYTIHESDENYRHMRHGVSLYCGGKGLATKQEVIDFLQANGESSIDDLISHAMEMEKDE